MDIVVKSFNRPYYLERCLRSIYQYVTGDFTIQVLDDGTPPHYLNRIQELFPEVQIFRSPLYEQKVAALKQHMSGGRPFDQRTIPIAFWKEHISQCTDVFLLLEDDIWLTAPVLLPAFVKLMQTHHLATVKLSWLGNPRLVTGEKKVLDTVVEEVVPQIPLATSTIFLNKYRVRSVLYRLGLLRFFKSDFEYQIPLYVLYSVASAFFNKEYWLYLWNETQDRVEEARQLEKAAHWFETHNSRFAKTIGEVTKTSFITSATNAFEGVDLDIFRVNHHFNEAWLRGELDPMQNFPRDLSEQYLRQFLDNGDPRTTYSEWLRWITRFKEQYQRIGCEVE